MNGQRPNFVSRAKNTHQSALIEIPAPQIEDWFTGTQRTENSPPTLRDAAGALQGQVRCRRCKLEPGALQLSSEGKKEREEVHDSLAKPSLLALLGEGKEQGK